MNHFFEKRKVRRSLLLPSFPSVTLFIKLDEKATKQSFLFLWTKLLTSFELQNENLVEIKSIKIKRNISSLVQSFCLIKNIFM